MFLTIPEMIFYFPLKEQIRNGRIRKLTTSSLEAYLLINVNDICKGYMFWYKGLALYLWGRNETVPRQLHYCIFNKGFYGQVIRCPSRFLAISECGICNLSLFLDISTIKYDIPFNISQAYVVVRVTSLTLVVSKQPFFSKSFVWNHRVNFSSFTWLSYNASRLLIKILK